MPLNKKFAHRPVRAGMYESICLRCFRTVGKAAPEDRLTDEEAGHTCKPEDLITLHGRMEPEKATSPERGEESA